MVLRWIPDRRLAALTLSGMTVVGWVLGPRFSIEPPCGPLRSRFDALRSTALLTTVLTLAARRVSSCGDCLNAGPLLG
ncbi:hypothetical protein [Pseudovibrio sp. SPO723]|uniref:hypothetical protein n=1 Tax=Nesiotobacter zosterae TaxID=392721 RepID=UPI0029C453B6|nr:hypothetical protein [Pseudovibrio sp. SPO723]MDX5595683.1 hypothetical protein [Pseudovibrio sp. SPO723]